MWPAKLVMRLHGGRQWRRCAKVVGTVRWREQRGGMGRVGRSATVAGGRRTGVNGSSVRAAGGPVPWRARACAPATSRRSARWCASGAGLARVSARAGRMGGAGAACGRGRAGGVRGHGRTRAGGRGAARACVRARAHAWGSRRAGAAGRVPGRAAQRVRGRRAASSLLGKARGGRTGWCAEQERRRGAGRGSAAGRRTGAEREGAERTG